jgi:hypothetical protein
MIKTLKATALSLLLLITFAACGGGGGGSSSTGSVVTNPTVHTKATVKIALTGNLPAGTSISGAGITVTLPVGVTVPTDSTGAVATGSVTPSGIFATGAQVTPIYTPASGANAATLKLAMASGTPAGESQTGEVATLVLDLAIGVAPTESSFALSELTVVNATTYDLIPGLSGAVTAVTLQ